MLSPIPPLHERGREIQNIHRGFFEVFLFRSKIVVSCARSSFQAVLLTGSLLNPLADNLLFPGSVLVFAASTSDRLFISAVNLLSLEREGQFQ
jgi:hypothetical protein